MGLNIALTGNPNVGKTSLYNRITGSFEHVGNWHGVTVSEISKTMVYNGEQFTVTDLPGFYSMTVYSFEEAISRDAVLKGENNVIVNVCESSNLSRNLYLTLQLCELNSPTVLVVNMMDELKKQGKTLKSDKITKELNIEVIPMSAKYKTDVNALMKAVKLTSMRQDHTKNLPYLKKLPLVEVERIISSNLKSSGLQKEWACLKVLEKDKYVLQKLGLNENQYRCLEKLGDWQSRVAQYRYEYIDYLTQGAICFAKDTKKRKDREVFGFSTLDKIVLNKYLALPLFFLLMAAIFFITFGIVGKFLSSLLELFFQSCLNNPITSLLNNIGLPSWMVALVGDGVIGGLGGILVFLPQVVLLFFFLALLEDSGYISRVAFMTDGLFRKIGLSGRSVFTMLMGFGCSATAVLTARGLEDEKMRVKTVLLTPFMSCSARLPVYTAIAGAFFTGSQPLIIFALYVFGAAVAVLLAALFEKAIKPLKSGKLSFIMEMPPYRMPTAERVLQILFNNAKVFIVRVGTVVFAFNVIVWILSNFSLVHGYVPDGTGSILQSIAGLIAPIFTPLGFGNWKAVTSLLSGLVAKEIVITSIQSLGGVSAIFTGEYAAVSATAFMTFTLLYVPCIATLGAIKKEIGFKWMIFSFVLQMGTAYIASLAVYWLGILLVGKSDFIWVIALAATALIIGGIIIKFAASKGGCGKNCCECKKSIKERRKNEI